MGRPTAPDRAPQCVHLPVTTTATPSLEPPARHRGSVCAIRLPCGGFECIMSRLNCECGPRLWACCSDADLRQLGGGFCPFRLPQVGLATVTEPEHLRVSPMAPCDLLVEGVAAVKHPTDGGVAAAGPQAWLDQGLLFPLAPSSSHHPASSQPRGSDPPAPLSTCLGKPRCNCMHQSVAVHMSDGIRGVLQGGAIL